MDAADLGQDPDDPASLFRQEALDRQLGDEDSSACLTVTPPSSRLLVIAIASAAITAVGLVVMVRELLQH